MAKALVSKSNLQNIADAIRNKNGLTTKYTPSTMAAAITAIPGGAYKWYGNDLTFIQKIYDETFDLKNDTTYPSWTASTTAKSIMATKTAGTFTASNMSTTSYLIRWKCVTNVAYNTGATLVKIPIQQVVIFDQYIYRRPSNWTNLMSKTHNYNVYTNMTALPMTKYYNAEGNVAVGWTSSYGLYGSAPTPTFSSSSVESPTVTAKTPIWYARCSTTYFDTTRYGDIDQENTTFHIIGEVYSLDGVDQVMRGAFDTLIDYVVDLNTPAES